MKRYLLCASLVFFIPIFARKKPGVQESKTFMWTRPAFMSLAADQAIWHSFIYNKRIDGGNSVQIKSMYQKSLSKERIKQYFLFGCKGELLVAGDNSVLVASRDVRAEWLGIDSDTFSGRLTINPSQKQWGFSGTFHKDFTGVFKDGTFSSFFDGTWLSVELPFFEVINDLKLEQSEVMNKASSTPCDIIQAFKQKDWLYSKICGERRDANFVGILAKFGRAYLAQDLFQVVYYSIFNIPFGNGQNPEYLFDSYIGTNRHFGMGAGVNFQVLLNQNASRYGICWFLNLEHLFMMRNKQLRTFDLKEKPWSRYMLYNQKNGRDNIPGVNIFTFNTRVRPYSWVEFSTGWRVITENFEAEVGYDLWGHGDERVKLLCDFQEDTYGIAGKDIDSISGNTFGNTASQSTIGMHADNDIAPVVKCNMPEDPPETICEDIFVAVKESDIDLSSAEAQSSINHKFHASFGYTKKGIHYDTFAGFGGAIEYPQKNSALHQWTIWVKVGGSH